MPRQEESRSISENVKWGIHRRFSEGKVSLPYKQFLGYEKGEDGRPKVVEEEAKVVQQIYRLYLEGKTPSGIARQLTDGGIPTPAGRGTWQPSTVKSILSNEKYKGDAVLGKRFTVDFLTKKRKDNTGESPMYMVENSHRPIVSPEAYDLVQHELQQRKARSAHSGASCFSSRIVCGECGGYLRKQAVAFHEQVSPDGMAVQPQVQERRAVQDAPSVRGRRQARIR